MAMKYSLHSEGKPSNNIMSYVLKLSPLCILYSVYLMLQIYTEWANHYLEKAKCQKRVENLQSDLSDGVLLSYIVQSVSELLYSYIVQSVSELLYSYIVQSVSCYTLT